MEKKTPFEQPTLLSRIKGILKKREEEIEELRKVKKELEEIKTALEERVKERTKELQEKIDELEMFHRLAVGRELKMVELKQEIGRLKEELEKCKPSR